MSASAFQRNDLTSLLPPLRSMTSFSSATISIPEASHLSVPLQNSDFYVILPDQDWTEKTGGIVKRGVIRAESLKGKFHRKLGSVEVLRHSEALSDEWIRKLYPGELERQRDREIERNKSLDLSVS
jgi:hypothetical protein